MSRQPRHTHARRLSLLAWALAGALACLPAMAQHAGHEGHAPAADQAAPAKKKPAPATTDPHAGHTMPAPAPAAPAKKKPAPATTDPHAGHTMPAPAPAAPAKKKPAPATTDPHAGHTMPAPAPAAPAKKKPAPATTDPHAGHTMPAPAPAAPAKKKPAPATTDPHTGHTMATPAPAKEEPAPATTDPHAGHTMPTPTPADPHAGHVMPSNPDTPVDHAAMGHDQPAPDDAPRTPIPALTDADRAAAFPRVRGHAAHDDRVHSYWEIDHLEAWDADPGTGLGWEATAWIGKDTRRVWLRSEGEQVDGDLEGASLDLLVGRSVTPWWDVVAGLRHEVGEGPSRTFLAFGVQGLAPQKFEVEATAYVGSGGQVAALVEAEYDTLLTNRLVLQWSAEASLHAQDDPRRGIGSGLGTIEAGVRLRYEVTRKFAPYLGVVRERAFGDTADLRRDDGHPVDDTRVVAGVRFWF